MSLSIGNTQNPSYTPTFMKVKDDNREKALKWISDISSEINNYLHEGYPSDWSPSCIVWSIKNHYSQAGDGKFKYFKVVWLTEKPTAFAIAESISAYTVELFLIGVKPENHRMHLGTAIMKDVIRKAQKKGYTFLKITFQKQAKSFYLKFVEREQLKAETEDHFFGEEPTGGEMQIEIPPVPGQPKLN